MSYEDLTLTVRESGGRELKVIASGHIGVKLVGHWDEMVIESAAVVEAHPFADECTQSIEERLGSLDSETGSPARNTRRFETLVVSFIDGALLYCVAAAFTADT